MSVCLDESGSRGGPLTDKSSLCWESSGRPRGQGWLWRGSTRLPPHRKDIFFNSTREAETTVSSRAPGPWPSSSSSSSSSFSAKLRRACVTVLSASSYSSTSTL